MKKGNPILKTIILLGLGALLAHFGLNLSDEQLEDVVDDVVLEVGKQTSKDVPESISLEQPELYAVLSVIDGDTFTIRMDGEKETVRVLGINTPETKYSSRGAECFGAEASDYAKRLLQGSKVALEQDSSQDTHDKYNRILAYVGLADGRDFGQVMIADGYAYEYTYRGHAHQNQTGYKNAQKRAKEEGIGLWQEGVCQTI